MQHKYSKTAKYNLKKSDFKLILLQAQKAHFVGQESKIICHADKSRRCHFVEGTHLLLDSRTISYSVAVPSL